MKKIVLTLVAVLSLTSVFAEDANSTSANNVEAAKYEININSKSLARTLGLDYYTANNVELVNKDFSNDMQKAASLTCQDRARAFKKAINRNLSYMHRLLDEDQYREYVKLLNVTLNNRGLNDK